MDGLLPLVVVTPNTVEEAAQVVALVNQHGLTLLARGGGSRMNVGGLPEQIDVLLETNKLTHLLEYEAPDLTCHVEAGRHLPLYNLNSPNRGSGLLLTHQTLCKRHLVGFSPSNASGPKRLRYGSARDQVIGLRIVQANGDIARSGGRGREKRCRLRPQ